MSLRFPQVAGATVEHIAVARRPSRKARQKKREKEPTGHDPPSLELPFLLFGLHTREKTKATLRMRLRAWNKTRRSAALQHHHLCLPKVNGHQTTSRIESLHCEL